MTRKKYDDPKAGEKSFLERIKKRLSGKKVKFGARLSRITLNRIKAREGLAHVPFARSALAKQEEWPHQEQISGIKKQVVAEISSRGRLYETRREMQMLKRFKEEDTRIVARAKVLDEMLAAPENIAQIDDRKLCEISNFCEEYVILNKIITLALAHFLRDEKDIFIMNCYLANAVESEFAENFSEIFEIAKIDIGKKIILFIEQDKELNSCVILPAQERYLISNSIFSDEEGLEDYEEGLHEDKIFMVTAQIEKKFAMREECFEQQASVHKIVCKNNTNDLMGCDHLFNMILNFYCGDNDEYDLAKICQKISEILGEDFNFDTIDDVIKQVQQRCDAKFSDRKYNVWRNILSAAAITFEQSAAQAPALAPYCDHMINLLGEIDQKNFSQAEQKLLSAARNSLRYHKQRIDLLRSQIYPYFEIDDRLKQRYLSIADVSQNQDCEPEITCKFLQILSQHLENNSQIDLSFVAKVAKLAMETGKRKAEESKEDSEPELSAPKATRLAADYCRDIP